MGLTVCHQCQKLISENATNCPNCGKSVGDSETNSTGEKIKLSNNIKKYIYLFIPLFIFSVIAVGIHHAEAKKKERVRAEEARKQKEIDDHNAHIGVKLTKLSAKLNEISPIKAWNDILFIETLFRDEKYIKNDAYLQDLNSIYCNILGGGLKTCYAKKDYQGLQKILVKYYSLSYQKFSPVGNELHGKVEYYTEKLIRYRLSKLKSAYNRGKIDKACEDYNSLKKLISIEYPSQKLSKLVDSIQKYGDLSLQRKRDIDGKKVRKVYASILRNHFLDQGLDIKVKVSGSLLKTISLEYVLFNDVWVHNFKKGDLLQEIADMDFKTIKLRDGYGESWTLTFK